MEVVFTVNGEESRILAGEIAPDTSLNTYLRTRLCLTGTKFMCQEGGCGCCIVTIQGVQPVTQERFTLAINSCLFLVFSCHGLSITTIEGLGDKKKGYHAMQQSLAHFDGSQCGYCSPGFVMNMFSLYMGKYGSVTAEEVEDSFGGNICRCTGYRPILDAFKSFATNASQDLKSLCADIEDLSLKKCPKSGKSCSGGCRSVLHVKAADNAEWHKVYTLSEVLQILSSIGSRKYRLVAGNTAHGIYRIPYDIEVFVDVSSVTELRDHSIGNSINLGGNITITEWMAILLEASDLMSGFNYCRLVRDHLNRIATVPVRNIGTIAGNLMIKHNHNEFYSDVFLLLETIGATITITNTNGELQTVSPQNFLTVNMDKNVITLITMPQLAPDRFRLRSYKMTDRAQNAITYMNAGFLLEMTQGSGIIQSSRIVFGGVNSSFIHANSIESYINGKDLFDNETIQTVINMIDSDFVFDDTLPNSSAEFRRRLAKGLFYKAVLNLAPSSLVQPHNLSGSSLITRPLSSGQQTYDTIPENYPLTQPIMKVEALIQCSGEAEFINDIHLPKALWGALVLAKNPLQTIVSIDASEALSIEGVKAFYAAKHIPGENSFSSQKGPILPFNVVPEEVFCSGKVLYHGQPVGIIVAEEMSQAVHGADLVKIAYASQIEEERSFASSIHRFFTGNNVESEEKLLPTLNDVLQEDPKNVEKRFRFLRKVEGASYKNVSQLINNIQGYFVCGPQYHYHMETQTTLAVPTEDGMDIYASTQWIDFTQRVVAQVLGVKENTINIKLRRLGGAYGGKIFRNGIVACATAVACYHQHRPIRMVLPMETNMAAIGKRMPAAIDYNVNFSDVGTVLNLHTVVTHDLGITPNDYIMLSNLLFSANAYITATWLTEYKSVTTDAPTNTWMRAPGSTEMIAYTETIMEHIAWALEKDPIEVRLANIAIVNPIRVILRDFLENCEYYRRLEEVNTFNRENRWRKRGIAITLMQYPHANLGTYEALVSIYHGDGSVVLYIAGIEMGQGLYTKTIQIAAYVLGIPLDKIKIAPPDNIIGANSMTTAGSFTSDTIGHAVKMCCEILNSRLAPIKLLNPTGTWEDTVQAAYLANVELIASYQFTMGEVLPYIIYGVACAEIEIDVLTGSFQLRRVDIVEDTGESISPRIDVGQVEGAFIMGMGYWLHEKLIYDRSNGELLTNRSWNYKPPGAKDIPVDFRVTLLQKSTNPLGVLRSKICSEPAVTMAVVVVSALRKALESARKDADEPDIFLNFSTPTTVEDILNLAGTKNNQFVL